MQRKIGISGLWAIGGLLLCSCAQHGGDVQLGVGRLGCPENDREAEILASLDRNIIGESPEDTSLRDLIDVLEIESGREFQAYWRSMESAGIDPTVPLSLNLKGLSVLQAMKAIESKVEAEELTQVVFEVVDGMILFATVEDIANRYRLTRNYYVGDILAADLSARRVNIPVGYGGFDGPALVRAVPAIETLHGPDALMELLMEMVYPESWVLNGGNVGSLIVYGNSLVVRQTPREHRSVGQVLADIREQIRSAPHKGTVWLDFVRRPSEPYYVRLEQHSKSTAPAIERAESGATTQRANAEPP